MTQLPSQFPFFKGRTSSTDSVGPLNDATQNVLPTLPEPSYLSQFRAYGREALMRALSEPTAPQVAKRWSLPSSREMKSKVDSSKVQKLNPRLSEAYTGLIFRLSANVDIWHQTKAKQNECRDIPYEKLPIADLELIASLSRSADSGHRELILPYIELLVDCGLLTARKIPFSADDLTPELEQDLLYRQAEFEAYVAVDNLRQNALHLADLILRNHPVIKDVRIGCYPSLHERLVGFTQLESGLQAYSQPELSFGMRVLEWALSFFIKQ